MSPESSKTSTLQQKAQAAAKSQRALTIKSYKLPPQTEAQIEETLGVFLEEMGRATLKDSLGYCLRELLVNGKKANTKRVYFQEKQLDLESDSDYVQGMKNFKEETFNDIHFWLDKQEEAGLYVRITFQVRGRELFIEVGNNTRITRKEQIRIYDRIARSRAFRSLEEAMTTVLDDSEGAGLGIVILVLMLKKIGLTEDAFDIDVEGEETVARLVIPMDQTTSEHLDTISAEIAQYVDSLPQFPESILELQRMIEDPDVEMGAIARTLSRDPSLTADLLKTVNSARFMLPRRMDNVVEAVKLVGLRGLKQMLFGYGTKRILGEETETSRRLWEHSQRTAYFAYGIARNVMKRKNILDDVYVAGILHDMGKMVFSNLHEETVNRINDFCERRGIPTTIFERMSDGIDHAEVGAKIAEKWNFPDVLVSSIRFHHKPLKCEPPHREVTMVVAVANELAHMETYDPDHIDARMLRGVGLDNDQKAKQVFDTLKTHYEKDFQTNQ